MAVPASLTTAERVDCKLCGVTMTGADVVEHDASPEHNRRKGSFFIDKAVQKVSGWGGCPGPCYPPKGILRLDG